MEIDNKTRAALARLTANEKACLRRRLLPQTAKEMALALGISPHAVEKRLKMARTKLGLSSSLEAARLLAAFEDQTLVPQSSDLSDGALPGQTGQGVAVPRRRLTLAISGAAVMILLFAATALLIWQQDTKVSFEEATAYLEASFDRIDRDKSGFLDAADSPRVTVQGQSDIAPKAVDTSDAASMWITRLDANGDGKVSREEWVTKLRPGVMERGIPTQPPASR